jgi:excinuclease UvrABC nuclease subunit
MQSQDLKKIKISNNPGVYFFKKGKQILYIGKATSLRDRTKSYFSKDLIATRGPMILDMVVQADNIDWEETDSVLEALILEASLIKKNQPKYNIKEKDDKSWNYVCITKEEIPKVLIIRGRELEKKKHFRKYALGAIGQGTHFSENSSFSRTLRFKNIFGPYTNGLQLREAMRIIRRIFPYIDGDSIKKNNKEFYKQLGLTPDGVRDYKENIKNLKLFFQGKKKKIIQNLKKEMLSNAKVHNFEKAGEIKKKIFALSHINDVALIKNSEEYSFAGSLSVPVGTALPLSPSACETPRQENSSEFLFRIEAYDIAHMSGKNMVGVMTVMENGEVAKCEYKKFIIRTQSGANARQSRGGNDTGALEEVLSRRFRHTEWGLPKLIVVDGSIAQINVAKRVLNRYQFNIPVVGVVKDDRHKAKAIQGDEQIIKKYKKLILLANSEAHRFAIKFYRAKSRKKMFE